MLGVFAEAAELRELKSVEKSYIRVEYDLTHEISNSNKPSSYDYAKNLRIVLKRDDLKSDTFVRAVFINKEYFKGYCGLASYLRSPNYIMDLTYDSELRGFVGKFENARLLVDDKEVPLSLTDRERVQLRVNGYCQQVTTEQELAFVVGDGEWQTDPVNQTHNFQLKLF